MPSIQVDYTQAPDAFVLVWKSDNERRSAVARFESAATYDLANLIKASESVIEMWEVWVHGVPIWLGRADGLKDWRFFSRRLYEIQHELRLGAFLPVMSPEACDALLQRMTKGLQDAS